MSTFVDTSKLTDAERRVLSISWEFYLKFSALTDASPDEFNEVWETTQKIQRLFARRAARRNVT